MNRSSCIFEKKRKRIKALLEHYEYGRLPDRPLHLSCETTNVDKSYASGKATLTETKIRITLKGGDVFCFPLRYAIPNSSKRPPVIVHLNYRGDMPDRLQPTEELCDAGFALFTLAYEDITADNDDHKSRAAAHLVRGRRRLDSPGKLMLWAWGAMRVMDHIESLSDRLDTSSVAIIGHGILGTSALLAGGFDERFACVISSCSGWGGAADVNIPSAPLLALQNRAPYLFCGRYLKLSAKETPLPFTQSELLSLVAPRPLLISTADDAFTDAHLAEKRSTELARSPYEEKRRKASEESANDGSSSASDDEWRAAFRLRDGLPYISREDWKFYIDFIKANRRH